MAARQRFSRSDVCRILEISEKQLGSWERLDIIGPKSSKGDPYDFRDLISLRTAKQLIEQGVKPENLKRSLEALRTQLSNIHAPLNELRIRSNGKHITVETSGSHLEPISGQFMMNFSTQELSDRVVQLPDRNADGLFELALEFDGKSDPAKAAEVYDRVIALDPFHVDALLNRGILAYEQGDLEAATDYFKRAVEVQPDNPLARFNLGTTLDDRGFSQEARQHLRLAVRLDPGYADAHYNLAAICDKIGAIDEALEHWKAYLQIEPNGEHHEFARDRLARAHLR